MTVLYPTRGIGEYTAYAFAKEGIKLVLSARRKDKLEVVEKKIKEGGGEAISVVCDVSNRSQVENLFFTATKHYGTVDILFNNAGVFHLSKIKNLKLDEWDKMIDVNLKGALYCIASVLPILKQKKEGHIFNISSDADRKLFNGSSVYSSTKAALTLFSEGLKKELIEEGFQDIKVRFLVLDNFETD